MAQESPSVEENEMIKSLSVTTVETWLPQCELEEGPQSYSIKMDLPSFRKDEVHIEVDGNVLKIMSKKLLHEKNPKTLELVGTPTPLPTRTFVVPDDGNMSAIVTEFGDGYLRVEIPKFQTIV